MSEIVLNSLVFLFSGTEETKKHETLRRFYARNIIWGTITVQIYFLGFLKLFCEFKFFNQTYASQHSYQG